MAEEVEKLTGLTKDIVEQFLERLKETDLEDEIIDRLRVAIIEDGKHTEKALLAELFPEK